MNEDVLYRVLIYHEKEVIEDTVVKGQWNAYEYGESKVRDLDDSYWFRVKAQ